MSVQKSLIDMSVKAHYDGKTTAQIADIVNKAGFKTRLGTDFNKNNVSAILRKSGVRKRKPYKMPSSKKPSRQKRAPQIAVKKDRMKAVKSVLELAMDPSERIALALMIIG